MHVQTTTHNHCSSPADRERKRPPGGKREFTYYFPHLHLERTVIAETTAEWEGRMEEIEENFKMGLLNYDSLMLNLNSVFGIRIQIIES